MLKRLAIVFGACLLMCSEALLAQEATWIWYPGDFDIWLSNKMQNRRTERGTFFPPFWKMDNHYVCVDFHKDFNLAQPEQVNIYTEGNYNVKIDGKMQEGAPSQITVPAGKHRINVKIFNQATVPAMFVKGQTIVSDGSWLVTFEDKEWIDETGKASDQAATVWLTAGSKNFNDPSIKPSSFKLLTTQQYAASVEKKGQSLLIDFGKETFGYVKLNGLRGNGKANIYYGESKAEALSTDHCETLDRLQINNATSTDTVLPSSKAFRFVNIQFDGSLAIDSVSMLYEYAPVAQRGTFRCSDTLLNKIYDVSDYTFHLNTREFFIDGIKRDRWVWSGDGYQSFLMNYYSFFNSPTVTSTLMALRGKDPVTSHINTIMDYTFYWFMGIYDYYLYTGDQNFITQVYPRMQSMMDYCLQRRNKDGLMEGLAGDWIFIDWADGLSKKGEVSFEQLLLCRSLETMSLCADLMHDAKAAQYRQMAADMKDKIFSYYWNSNKQAFVHSRINGQPTDNVTRYTNMFAIFFNYLSDAQKQGVKQNVLLNDKVQKITTPYMRFYELEAMCALGEQQYVLNEIKSYWGGMLQNGATTFWEEYNPNKKGDEHYAMYGRPFGKSLCHAWGASPIYLFGKYYLGVQPTSPAYKTYTIQPVTGGLKWIEGTVPTPNGVVNVYCSAKQIKVKAGEGTGTLKFKSKKKPSCKNGAITSVGDGAYEMTVEKGMEYIVNYEL
jgi:hypothetical protein